MRLHCPHHGKTFDLVSARWEDVEGREIRCPVCQEVHEAVQAEDPGPVSAPPPVETPPLVPAGPAPPYRLYGIGAIALAAFLGSPIAGAILMAVNFRRLGRRGAAIRAVGIGAVGSAAVAAMAFLVPEDLPGAAVWFPPLLVVLFAAMKLQGPAIEAHQAAGGRRASVGLGALIGLACGVVILLPILAWALLTPFFPGERIDVFQDDEIYYSGGATEADARRLADLLKEEGFLGNQGATVHLEKTEGACAVGIVLKEGAWERDAVRDFMRDLGRKIAEAGLGRPVTMRFYDEAGDLQDSLVVE